MKGFNKKSTAKQNAKAKSRQKRMNKYEYRLAKKQIKYNKFKQKQITKRVNVIPESIKAAGQAFALGSSPTASSIASAEIVKSDNNVSMAKLINPTSVADTNNAEEEERINDGYKVR